MKRILPALLLSLALCDGCATKYSIILNNGDIITSKGRPTYDSQRVGYYYNDIHGQKSFVFASKVREVAPASRADKNGSQFLSK